MSKTSAKKPLVDAYANISESAPPYAYPPVSSSGAMVSAYAGQTGRTMGYESGAGGYGTAPTPKVYQIGNRPSSFFCRAGSSTKNEIEHRRGKDDMTGDHHNTLSIPIPTRRQRGTSTSTVTRRRKDKGYGHLCEVVRFRSQCANTRWVRCSGELQYQGPLTASTKSFIARILAPSSTFVRVDILPWPIT